MLTLRSPRTPPRRRRHGRALAAVVAIVVWLGAACAADRPELVQPVADDDTVVPTTTPLPDRSACATASGPGPAAIVLAPETRPCVVVAAHHRLEITNQDLLPIGLAVGSASFSLATGAVQVTEPAGTILVAGPNRLAVGPDTVAVAWLAEPSEDSLLGHAIGLSSIGDIELGLEPAAVTALTGIPVAAGGNPCHMATLVGDPYSPLFTFRNGQLVVVQVFTPGVVTRSGIGIGSTSADIAAAYGDQIETRLDPAGEPASQLLVFVPSDEENQIYRLVFDLTDDRVTTMRFGATEIVADRPGCGS